MRKKTLAVLFGGCSPEYEISLQSAYSVIKHIDKEKYELILLGLNREGQWYWFRGKWEKIIADSWCNNEDCQRAIISPDRQTHGLLVYQQQIQEIYLDAAFPLLHGKNGEDGTIQGLLELAGIPIIGSGCLASSLCMNKQKAHAIANNCGIAVAPAITISYNTEIELFASAINNLGFPLFVKPVASGSSFGISKVTTMQQLASAVSLAFQYDDEVIVEKCIDGFEIGCAIMGVDDLVIGEIDEIELFQEFYDYSEKYHSLTTNIHLPARLSPQLSEYAKETAVKIYRSLGCRGFARVDMFVTKEGQIVFNEVNTIPGFTDKSRFPLMLQALDKTYRQVVNEIIAEGIDRK